MSHFHGLTSWIIPKFDEIIHCVWFETFKLHLSLLQVWPYSIYKSSFWPLDFRWCFFLFLTSQETPSQEFVSADEVDSGLCSECVSPILTLIFVQVPHRLSPSICSTQHSDPYPWPGPVHRMPRLLLTCAVENRFCLQCGTAIVSWSPELLYLSTESLLTPKCGTISHLSLHLRDLHVATQVCLLDTQTLSTFLSSLFFFSHGFFPKLPWISTHAGRCFRSIVRVHPDCLPKASKFYLLPSQNTQQQVDKKTQEFWRC